MHWRSDRVDAGEDCKSCTVTLTHVSGRLLTDNNVGTHYALHVSDRLSWLENLQFPLYDNLGKSIWVIWYCNLGNCVSQFGQLGKSIWVIGYCYLGIWGFLGVF